MMNIDVILRGLAAAALVFASATAQASTVVTVWNLNWTGQVGTDGVWGITSSGGAGESGAFNPGFDHKAVSISITGEVLIRASAGLAFTSQDVVGLTLNVTNNGTGAWLADYSIEKDNLLAGFMSGVLSGAPGDGATATLTSLLLREKKEAGYPFSQFIGCPGLFNNGCGDGFFGIEWGNDPSGLQTRPEGTGLGSLYGVITLSDGRSDPCCTARTNSLQFFYLTPEDAMASFRLTFDGRRVLPDDPGGLPSPIPLPAALPLLLGGLGLLGWIGRRRSTA